MKALLVVDIQTGSLKNNKVHKEELFIKTVNNMISDYRVAGNLIVFTQHNNKKLENGKNDWKIDERILRKNDDIVIQKFHGNAFVNTDLRKIFDEHNIDDVTVCGLATHACVMATSHGCITEGYKTHLLKNGHSNWQSDPKQTIRDVEAELWGMDVITGN